MKINLALRLQFQITTNIGTRPNSPGPLRIRKYLMDDSSVNFHNKFVFIFAKIQQKMKKKLVMEIYG